MSVADDIADAQTRHDIGLNRLSNATVRKIIALLSRADARIVSRMLEEGGTDLGRRRQEQLLRDIRAIVDSAYADATGQLTIDLEQLARYETEYQLELLERIVPVNVEWIAPAADNVVAAVNSRPFQGRYLREWYDTLGEATKSKLRDTIRTGVVEGRTIEQLVRDVRGTRSAGYKDGVLEMGRRNAEAVVRTSVNHTVTRAREAVANRNSRYVMGMQVLATLDTRTSSRCRAADGAVIRGDGVERSEFPSGTRFLGSIASFTNDSRPPFHVNCRTSLTMVLRPLSAFGIDAGEVPASTRSSMDGQVAGDQTYSQWLRKQPVAVQEDVLGKEKARLFRKGEIDLDRFLARDGGELTLEELRRKEKEAWSKAFNE